jgi:hypothetical protein
MGSAATIVAAGGTVLWWFSAAVGLILVLAAGAAAPESPAVWRHLATGRTIAESGLPERDPFTVLGAQRTWANPSWLFDLALYFIYVAGGDAGLVAARFLLLATLGLLLLSRARGAGGLAAALPVVVALPALQGSLNLSPMLPGLILLAVFGVTLDRWELQRSGSMVAWLAAIQVLWTNTSSTIIVGPLLVVLRCFGAAIDEWSDGAAAVSRTSHPRMLWLVLAVGVASLASPYALSGIRAASIDVFAAFVIGGDGQTLVGGLAPLWSVAWSSPLVVAFLILLAAALLSALCPAIQVRSLLPTAILSALGVADMRVLPLAVVWLVLTNQRVIADSFFPEQPAISSLRRLFGTAAIVAAGGVGFLIAVPAREGWRQLERQVRGMSVAQIRHRWLSQGQITGAVLLLDPSDAGWLVWGNGKLRPMLDDRCELFADKYSTYRRLCRDVAEDRHNSFRRTDGSLGGWRQFANVVPFHWIVTRATDVETNRTLNSSPHWGPAYWDAEVVIFGAKQNEQVVAAGTRLNELRSLGIHGVDNVPELYPSKRESYRLIRDDEARQNYSPRELVDLAMVYHALDVPAVADYLIRRLDDPRLVRATEDWLHGSRAQERWRNYRVQKTSD